MLDNRSESVKSKGCAGEFQIHPKNMLSGWVYLDMIITNIKIRKIVTSAKYLRSVNQVVNYRLLGFFPRILSADFSDRPHLILKNPSGKCPIDCALQYDR